MLTGAGLLLHSLQKLGHVDAGFDAQHVLAFQVGAFLSALGSHFLARMLYGVWLWTQGTYFGVLLFVLLAAIVACALPTRRAAQVEPVSALRSS